MLYTFRNPVPMHNFLEPFDPCIYLFIYLCNILLTEDSDIENIENHPHKYETDAYFLY